MLLNCHTSQAVHEEKRVQSLNALNIALLFGDPV